MKIAVVHNLPAGGQKRALYNQVKILSQKHKIDLFTLSSTDESFLPLRKFVRHHYTTPYVYPGHFPKSVISIYFELSKAYKNLAEKINKGNYNVAFVNPCYLTQAPFVLRFLKTPSLYYCPESKREFYEKIPRISNRITYTLTYPFRLPLKLIDKINVKKATRILTNSKYSKERIDDIYKVSSFVNYLGVDTSLFKPNISNILDSANSFTPIKSGCFKASTSGESSSGRQTSLRNTPEVSLTPFVLSVGELSLHKGHDFIIRSLGKVKERLRPKLMIVGHEGVEKKYFKKLAKSFKVKTEILENASDEELVSLYNKAKVFLYASINEPFGMVLLEASSCGLPIIAVKEGGVGEIVTDKLIGELIARDEEKFARVVEKYLRAETSLTDIRKRHESVKKKWSWERSVGELERYLKETISGKVRS